MHEYYETLDTQGFSIKDVNEKPLIYKAPGIFVQQSPYLVPLMGLILDYVYTYSALEKRNNEFFREIHERKAAERKLHLALTDLKQAQVQLIQSEKMSGLGQMVSGIAHEINNPVNFIHGNLKHLNGFVA